MPPGGRSEAFAAALLAWLRRAPAIRIERRKVSALDKARIQHEIDGMLSTHGGARFHSKCLGLDGNRQLRIAIFDEHDQLVLDLDLDREP